MNSMYSISRLRYFSIAAATGASAISLRDSIKCNSEDARSSGIYVYLDNDSVKKLISRHFDDKIKPNDLRHVDLLANLSLDQKEKYESIVGKSVIVNVSGEARSQNVLTFIAQVEVEDGSLSLHDSFPIIAVPLNTNAISNDSSYVTIISEAEGLARGLKRLGIIVPRNTPDSPMNPAKVAVRLDPPHVPTSKVKYATYLTYYDPIILRGVLCVDGRCKQDTELDVAKNVDTEKPKEGAKWECPLCVIMRNSPCSEPFEEWKMCIDAAQGIDGTDEADNEADDENDKVLLACEYVVTPMRECLLKHPEIFEALSKPESYEE